MLFNGGGSVLNNLFPLFQNSFERQYELSQGAELGRGRYGVVKKATHKESGQTFAVKMICKCKCNPKEMEVFEREVEIMRLAAHPSCVSLKESIATSRYLYIVMELLEGGELCERISSRSHYSETEAAECFVQLLQAVAHLHRNGIVHRDIKPENILYMRPEPDPRIKLVDFGLSRIVQAGGQRDALKTICGTPCFVAPEVLQGQGYGQACDCWSAGGILYLLLCGHAAFEQDSAPLKFEAIKRADYAFAPEDSWADISPQAKELAAGLMRLEAAERLSAEEALEHCWMQSFLSGALPKERMEHMQRRLAEWGAARKLRASVLACAALSRIVGGARSRPLSPLLALHRLRKVREDRGREEELREAFRLLVGGEEGGGAVEEQALSTTRLLRALAAARMPPPAPPGEEPAVANTEAPVTNTEPTGTNEHAAATDHEAAATSRQAAGTSEEAVAVREESAAPREGAEAERQEAAARACLQELSAWGGEALNWEDFLIMMGPAPTPRSEQQKQEERGGGPGSEGERERGSEEEEREEVHACFECLDRDHCGSLSADQLREALGALGECVSPEEAEVMVRLADRKSVV